MQRYRWIHLRSSAEVLHSDAGHTFVSSYLTGPRDREAPPPDAAEDPRRNAATAPRPSFDRAVGRQQWISISSMSPSSTGTRSGPRSEEHTSELQSRFDLVCRLLLATRQLLQPPGV